MSEADWWKWISDPLILENGSGVVSRADWVRQLFGKYIYPTLKRLGFQLVGKPDKIMRRFLWFWRHLWSCGYDVADPLPEPNADSASRPVREYFDIFNNIFAPTIYDHIKEGIAADDGALDDSYLGRRLLAELPAFLWSNIDIANSKQFIKYEEMCAEIEEAYKQLEEGDMSLEELDRRRMMKNKGYDPDYIYDKHA